MGRPLRHITPGALVEVTCRTIQGRALLRPDPELNRRFLGVLGRAQRRECVEIHGISVLSNHFHGLLTVREPDQLARFMHYVQVNVSKEAGDLYDWTGSLWARRYTSIEVSDEPEAQVERLRYLLEQGVKEDLVARVTDWPGVHCARALLENEPLEGTWYDRTALYKARRRGEKARLADFAEPETVHLTHLPCWQGLPEDKIRARIAALVHVIERENHERRRSTGKGVLGVGKIRRRHPHDRPKKLDRSPAPRFHAATKKAWLRLRDAYNEFYEEFRKAAELLNTGSADPRFPPGSFPPGMPYVPHQAPG